MTTNEAMDLLFLKPGFTEQELNKNYKKLMMKWHPDICNEPNAILMTQKINEARELLKLHLRSCSYNNVNNSKNTNSCNDFNNYKKENIKVYDDVLLKLRKIELLSEIDVIFNGFNRVKVVGKASDLLLYKLLNLRKSICSQIKSCGNIDLLYLLFLRGRELILDLIKKYVYEYCRENMITCDFIDSYNCIIDNEFEVNIEKNIYILYLELERINNSRNIFIKTFSKIRKKYK